ncbi:MAG: GIY-YIG nuclease family protein [Sphingorhabdus sp.]
MNDLLTFTDCLTKSELALEDVRLLRHQEYSSSRTTPYHLWVESPDKLNRYQSIHRIDRRARFQAPYWCSFVATPDGSTLFVGVFSIRRVGNPDQRWLHPFDDKPVSDTQEQDFDLYHCILTDHLADYIGRLYIEWGRGTRSWVQLATSEAGQSKTIREIKTEFQEPVFPGYTQFMVSLNNVPKMPASWVAILRQAKGIYLLTCPKTKEQYVGKAVGQDGFFGRWMEYSGSGHGGNIGLKSRDPSNYQISILEVGGTATTEKDYDMLESLWKRKLQSREMGLNRN